jgi:hypothetical protein
MSDVQVTAVQPAYSERKTAAPYKESFPVQPLREQPYQKSQYKKSEEYDTQLHIPLRYKGAEEDSQKPDHLNIEHNQRYYEVDKRGIAETHFVLSAFFLYSPDDQPDMCGQNNNTESPDDCRNEKGLRSVVKTTQKEKQNKDQHSNLLRRKENEINRTVQVPARSPESEQFVYIL